MLIKLFKNGTQQLVLTKVYIIKSTASKHITAFYFTDVTSYSNQKLEKSKDHVNTSTPARAFHSDDVVYGFDLSPVHSYEMPSSALSKSVRIL